MPILTRRQASSGFMSLAGSECRPSQFSGKTAAHREAAIPSRAGQDP